MPAYTDAEARVRLDDLLAEAGARGEVRIRRRDGQAFTAHPVGPAGSPLDLGSVSLDPPVTADEIVAVVRQTRERSYP